MIHIDNALTANDLLAATDRLFALAEGKLRSIEASRDRRDGAPVFTVEGNYVSQGWTEWTEGFQYGSQLLQFDATGDESFWELGYTNTRQRMPHHVTHFGVHDHGFNQISTYGNMRRLAFEGRVEVTQGERELWELALRASGAVQAARWTTTAEGHGFVYSFNGPHSLFCDTIRSLRSLALAHRLGQFLWTENDRRVSLLDRLIQHAHVTAKWNVFYGQGRDLYDVRGRVAHESLFNTSDGNYRCPSTQQGYSPFSTWTRGLAWIMLGYPEQLEYLQTESDQALEAWGGRKAVEGPMWEAARAACDYYLHSTPTCGVPYWDSGAPGLAALDDYTNRPADPFNGQEPVDSSAAAIAAQGLLRLGRLLRQRDPSAADRYYQAGLTVARTLLHEPYLSTDPDHQGLLLHAVYHRPRGWDHVPPGSRIPYGESCQWGDYHLMELALWIRRVATGGAYLTFFHGD